MDKIRLCIGTNDGENIAKTHMGDTKVFHIYDILKNTENEFIEKRVNKVQYMDHANTDKMEQIIGIARDADVFVAHQKSKNFVRIASTTKYQPVIVKVEKISEILSVLNNSFQEIEEYVERRKNGEFFNTIPEFK